MMNLYPLESLYYVTKLSCVVSWQGSRKTNTQVSAEDSSVKKRRKADANESEENTPKSSNDAESVGDRPVTSHGKLSGFAFSKNV
jgi:hypothetical protein